MLVCLFVCVCVSAPRLLITSDMMCGMISYSRLFMWVATFIDVFNVSQTSYFHCCIIRNIKRSRTASNYICSVMCGRLMIKVLVHKWS